MRAMLGYPDFRSYGWQWRLCCIMRYSSCSNCVAVMLLKARGWRGTSLPRGSGNVWFSNPVRVLFFQLHSRYEKAEPVPGSFHASIFPHVGSLRLPTWGFQKHNSYRVANMGNDNIHYKYKAFKSTTRTELPFHLSPVILLYGHHDETTGWRLPHSMV